jgi:hypothetical protein
MGFAFCLDLFCGERQYVSSLHHARQSCICPHCERPISIELCLFFGVHLSNQQESAKAALRSLARKKRKAGK